MTLIDRDYAPLHGPDRFMPLSVREGDWRKRLRWNWRLARERVALRLAPWLYPPHRDEWEQAKRDLARAAYGDEDAVWSSPRVLVREALMRQARVTREQVENEADPALEALAALAGYSRKANELPSEFRTRLLAGLFADRPLL